MHPNCACNPIGVPPPPAINPPPSPAMTASFEFVSMGQNLDPDLGYTGAFVRRIANERAFPLGEIAPGSPHVFSCPGHNGRDEYAASIQPQKPLTCVHTFLLSTL